MVVWSKLTPLMRVWAEKGIKCIPSGMASDGLTERPRSPYFSFASTTIERPSGVSSASEASWAASASSCGRGVPHRDKLHRLAVAQGDRAGLIQQQHIHIPGGFDRPPRERNHVALDQAIHPGNADGREQPADGGGDQAHQQRHQHGDGNRLASLRRLCTL